MFNFSPLFLFLTCGNLRFKLFSWYCVKWNHSKVNHPLFLMKKSFRRYFLSCNSRTFPAYSVKFFSTQLKILFK